MKRLTAGYCFRLLLTICSGLCPLRSPVVIRVSTARFGRSGSRGLWANLEGTRCYQRTLATTEDAGQSVPCMSCQTPNEVPQADEQKIRTGQELLAEMQSAWFRQWRCLSFMVYCTAGLHSNCRSYRVGRRPGLDFLESRQSMLARQNSKDPRHPGVTYTDDKASVWHLGDLPCRLATHSLLPFR